MNDTSKLNESPLSDPGQAILVLGHLAAKALQEEDKSLRSAMNEELFSKQNKQARGLTYWLYETTLVYLVFKAWASDHYVKWDWEPVGKHARGAPPHLDLCVSDGNGELGFEAKWWNTDSAMRYLEYDAGKLRSWMGNGQHRRGFLMAFWWCDSDLNRWMQEAIAWATPKDGTRNLAYRAWFPTLDGTGSPSRTFVLMLIEIRPLLAPQARR